jgi:hypothetical protein
MTDGPEKRGQLAGDRSHDDGQLLARRAEPISAAKVTATRNEAPRIAWYGI